MKLYIEIGIRLGIFSQIMVLNGPVCSLCVYRACDLMRFFRAYWSCTGRNL